MSQAPIEQAYVEILPRVSPSFGSDVTKGVGKALSGLDSKLKSSLSGVEKVIDDKIEKPLQETARSVNKTADTMGGAIAQGIREGLGDADKSIDQFSRGVDGKLRNASGKFVQAGDQIGDSVTKGSRRAAKAAREAAGQTERAWGGVGTRIAGAFAGLAIGAKAISVIHDSIGAASDLNETVSKTEVILGDKAAAAAQRFADKAAVAFGQSKQQALDAIGTFAIFGKSAGLSGDKLAGFSTKFAGLASDLASFHNTSPEEAINAIGAALRGESEPIRRYGILLDDASLRQEALRQGLVKTTKEALTPQQKVLAVQALIYKQSKDAQGDFARTSGGLANQQRILAATTDNLKAKFGKVLLPVTLAVVRALNNNLIPAIAKTGEVIGPVISAVADKAGPALAKLSSFLAGLDLGDRLSQAVKDLQPTIDSVVAAVQRLVPVLKDGLNKFLTNAADIFQNAVLPAAKQLGAFIQGTFLPAVESLAKAFAKNVVPVIEAVVDALVNNLQPALAVVYEKFATKVLPVLLRLEKIFLKVALPIIKLGLAILGKLLPPLIRLIGPVLGTAIKVIATVIGAVFDFIGAVLNLGNTVGKIGGKIGAFFSFLGSEVAKLGPLFVTVMAAVGHAVSSGVEKALNFIKALPGKAVAALVNLGALIGGVIAKAFTFIVQSEVAGIEKVLGFLRALPGRAVQALGALAGALRGVLAGAFSGAASTVSKAITTVVDAVGKLPGKIKGLGKQVYNAGKGLIGEIFHGIKVAASNVGGFASDIAGAVKGAINDALNLPLKIGPIKALGKTIIPKITLIPKFFGKGGVVDKATLSVLGEAGKEAVVPATRRMGARAAAVIDQAGLLDIPQVQALIRRRFLNTAVPSSGAAAINPLNSIGSSTTNNVTQIGGATNSRSNSRTVHVDKLEMHMAPMGDAQQHAEQFVRRVVELMER